MVQYPLAALCTELWKRVGEISGCGLASAWQMWCRISPSLSVETKTLAEDLIHRVGPGGHFLGEAHTLEQSLYVRVVAPHTRRDDTLPGLTGKPFDHPQTQPQCRSTRIICLE